MWSARLPPRRLVDKSTMIEGEIGLQKPLTVARRSVGSNPTPAAEEANSRSCVARLEKRVQEPGGDRNGVGAVGNVLMMV